MILTIQDVALRLNLPVETINRWIRQGKIPMQLTSGGYTIHPEMLKHWAGEHNLKVYAETQPTESDCPDAEFDDLLSAMQRGGIFYNIAGETKETALRSAVDLLPNVETEDRELIYNKLVERELMASTGIGHGIALPHPRTCPEIFMEKPQISTCFLESKLDFGAIDHQPVTILMVLLSCSTKQHLSMISKLAYFLRDAVFRQFIQAVPSEGEIFNKLAAMEAKSS